MNYAKQKYKAMITSMWMSAVCYGETLDELNQRIESNKRRHKTLKVEIYTRDNEADIPELANWTLIETKVVE